MARDRVPTAPGALDRLPTALGALGRAPTAPLAAAGLIAGFGVAVGTGSRPLGGAVMGALGLGCMALWHRRSGPRTMWKLTAVGLGAFVVSHALGMLIGAWPSVLLCAAATALACERWSDAPWRAHGPVLGAPAEL